MIERFRKGLMLVRASWDVVRADRELLLLPVLAALSSIALIAIVFFGLFWNDVHAALQGAPFPAPGVGTYLVFALTSYALTYIAVFFNVAMICAADERMSGGDPTLGGALRAATAHARAIAPWALVSVLVSTALRAIEEHGGTFGKIAGTLLGIGWALATYLVLPVLVLEGLTVREAITRSKDLFRRTWGETVSGEVGMSLVGFLAVLLALPVLMLIGGGGQRPALIFAVVLGIAWFLFVAIALSALNTVFRVALYRYASDGEAPAGFEALDLGSVFPPKRRRFRG